MKSSWIFPVLAFQLILVFFAPPILLSKRKLFLADLWCFIWVGGLVLELLVTVVKKKRIHPVLYPIGFGAVLLGVIYLHGFVRPNLYWVFFNHTIFLKDTTAFEPLRELVIYLRYVCWFAALIIVAYWSSGQGKIKLSKDDLKSLQVVFVWCLGFASFFMILAKISPEARLWLGKLYAYNPQYEYWRDREYGVFPSPVEASFAFVLGGLLLSAKKMLSQKVFFTAIFFASVGFLLAKTITPLVALIAVTAIVLSWHAKGILRWSALIICLLGVVVVSEFGIEVPFIASKLQNFTYRFLTIGAYWDLLQMRSDYLVIGVGFVNTFTDNIYLFFLSRGGLVLFSISLWFFLVKIRKYWRYWTLEQKLIPLFFIVTGLTFDALIFRHVVVLMIVLGMPALTLNIYKK